MTPMVGNRLRGKKASEGRLGRDKALIARVMDDTHLGRHGAGKTSAFTCHETQRQYAAYNRKINCAFQASVTLPPGGRSREAAGNWSRRRGTKSSFAISELL